MQNIVWCWGQMEALGREDMVVKGVYQEDRLEQTLIICEALDGAVAVLVVAGSCYTVAVTSEGALWVWGYGLYGQLGLGDTENRLKPVRVGAEEVFGGLVLMAACDDEHTLIVTKNGTLWTCGEKQNVKPDARTIMTVWCRHRSRHSTLATLRLSPPTWGHFIWQQ